MLIKQLSYKKFSVVVDVPIYSDVDRSTWITIKYMVRYRIPSVSSKAMLMPCADKKFLKDFFDNKFKGLYRVIYKTEAIFLEDGAEYTIYVPTNIRINKPIQELRDTSLDDLLNNLEQ